MTGVVLGSFAAAVSLVYHYLQDPTFHQTAFALMTVVVLVRSFWLMESRLRAVDPAVVNRMWRMVVWGISVFLAGVALWTVDNTFCGQLRAWRRRVGMPWGFATECHGWWHLLTGIGAYYELMYGIYLRHCLDGNQHRYTLDWPGLFSLPIVRRWAPGERQRLLSRPLPRPSSNNGRANGHPKKSL